MNLQQTNLNKGNVNTVCGGNPPKIEFTELVTISLGLRIKSEVGDEIEFCPGLFTDNVFTEGCVWDAFNGMVEKMREQICSYLDRRKERRDSWKG